MKGLRYLILSPIIFFILSGFVTAQEANPGFTVKRFVIAGGIENREPVNVMETFPSTIEKVYCFIEARDIQEDTNITIVWSLNGKEVNRTSLPLKKGFRWRTYAEKNLYGMRGEWKVDLLDSAGMSLKSLTFKVE